MIQAGELTERITFHRYDDAAETYGEIDDTPTVWAAAQALGEERYEFRIRYRDDLVGLKDAAPAMRVLYRDRVLDVLDIVEADRRAELRISAAGRLIDSEILASGAKRRIPWPSA